MKKASKKIDTTVVVECIFCKTRRKIGPGEIPADSVPFCKKCYNPMVAVSAKSKVRKGK